jgi:hypothetical protein
MRFALITALILANCSIEAFVSRTTLGARPTTTRTVVQAEADSLMDKLMDSTSTAPTDAAVDVTTTIPDTVASDAAATPPGAIVVERAATTVMTTPPASADTSAIADLKTVALVVGQENYGLAIVLLGEAIWSFSRAPSVDHGVKTLVPAIVAAVILVAVSGPMVTSEDAGSVFTGLGIATGVSILMGVAYVARLAAPYSPSPKEIPALGLLVAVAGFFSFSQNLVVDGFVQLPSLPPLPSFPSIDLPF